MREESKGGLSLQRGKIARPQKVAIYGPEGVGKSTLAGQLPNPVFLDTEGGTHHLDVVRLDGAETWEEINKAVQQLATGEHEFKSLVVDTADWLERKCAEYVCKKANKESIEDFGYGKGFTLVAEEFQKFLVSLDGLLAKGMHIVFLAHSTVKKFESPEQAGAYDRFELKMSKQVAPLIKEWCDTLLFATYLTRVAEGESGKKRAVGGKERVIYTTHSAAYDAKNRHGLADKLPFSIESLAPIFGGAIPAKRSPQKTASEQFGEIMAAHENAPAIREFLIHRGQIKADGSFADVGEDYAKRVLSNPAKFLQAVSEKNQQNSKE